MELHQLDSSMNIEGDEDVRVVVMMVRAPYARGRAGEFGRELVKWARGVGCIGSLMLVSGNAAGRRDGQLNLEMGVRWFWSGGGGGWGLGKRVEKLGMKVVEGAEEMGWNVGQGEGIEGEGVLVRAGWLPMDREGNFVRVVLEEGERIGWKIVGLLVFAHEGDNAEDSCGLAEVVRSALGLEGNGRWKWPESWENGRGPPVGLY